MVILQNKMNKQSSLSAGPLSVAPPGDPGPGPESARFLIVARFNVVRSQQSDVTPLSGGHGPG